MPSKEEIFSMVRDVLVSEFEIDFEKALSGAHLVDDLDLDSIDAIDLAVRLEQKYEQTLEEDELKSLETIGDIVNLVHGKLLAVSA